MILRKTTAEQSFAGMVGRSPKMLEVFRLVETVCRTNIPVLISGESGTGKELVARAIHLAAARRDVPFVAVNCGAMPETLLESELFGHVRGAFTGADQAQTGPVRSRRRRHAVPRRDRRDAADDAGQAAARAAGAQRIAASAATTRSPVDIRVIAATNRDLRSASSEGEFREDLFYRLNVIPMSAAAARARRGHPADRRALPREIHGAR